MSILSVRQPAVAGTFYPRQPEVLRAQVESLLSAAKPLAALPKAVIVPHAGYPYSGAIAATAYAQLAAASATTERVILIGPAHRVYVAGVATAGAAQFLSPLGLVEVDLEWLKRVPELAQSPAAHAPEHCLEVQLPFIQRVLPAARIVPLLVSDAPPAQVGSILERLWGGAETRIIVSSDLSHYLPYRTAQAIDKQTAERILNLDESLDGERACGCAAISGLLWVARRLGLRPELLDLRNSGDTAGGRDEVVGYGAFAFYEAQTGRASPEGAER